MTTTDVQQPGGYGRPDFDKRSQVQKLELTPEETKAWQDCMKTKSVLGSTIVSAALSYGVFRITPFRAQAKYAAICGGVLGMIIGRLSATEICLAKVASLPNSTLRDRMLEAKYGNRYMSERQIYSTPGTAPATRGSEEPSAGIVFDDYAPMNSYDSYSSLNDSSDTPTSEDTDLSEPINLQKGITYDELRHKNREEYYEKTKKYYASKLPERYPTPEATRPEQQAPTRASMQEKTKYGDVWG